jgi:hypothetical protein
MALILGLQLFHIRVMREIRGSAALTFGDCDLPGFGNWDLELETR